jgi:hypothetical protein
MQSIGTLLYQGKKHDIFARDQRPGLVFAQDMFWVDMDLAKDFEKIKTAYDSFCKDKMVNIIEKGIEKFRWKSVKTQLQYTNGTKSFFQQAQYTAQEYLKAIGFSTKIDYKIGKFEKEWGINEIKTGEKSFTLYFNLDLIKFDAGDRILLVVAHEMAHIFHRDHGPDFQSVLEQLYPNKRSAENFFNDGVRNLMKPNTDSYNPKTVLVILLSVLAVVGVVWCVIWIQSLFGVSNLPIVAPTSPKQF